MRVLSSDALVMRPIASGLYIVDEEPIRNAPTFDAEPAVRGHWEKTKDGAAWCSACKRKMNPSLYGYPRCAMCGAMMDEGSV